MHKGKCVANEGDETPGKTEEEKFENELRNACKYLTGARCSTYTHAKYYRIIRSIDPKCQKKKAYKGTLKKSAKFLEWKMIRKSVNFTL